MRLFVDSSVDSRADRLDEVSSVQRLSRTCQPRNRLRKNYPGRS